MGVKDFIGGSVQALLRIKVSLGHGPGGLLCKVPSVLSMSWPWPVLCGSGE